MIIWLASYPKSGNTFLRSLLTSYFYTSDGNFNFELLEKIKQFPDKNLFKNLGLDTTNDHELARNFIKVQKTINTKDGQSIRFLKTHSVLKNDHGYLLSNLKHSLGVIYVVRDPRSVARSYANHMQISLDDAIKVLTSYQYISSNRGNTLMGDWSSNYHTWKEYAQEDKYLLIKYEDLVENTQEIFLKILEFIHQISQTKFNIDDSKFLNSLNSTKFEKLQNLEKQKGFQEAAEQNGKKITFFKYGSKNNGSNSLPVNLRKKVERIFTKEMSELGYI